MTLTDIIILIITIILVLSIVFFSFVLPKIQGDRITCAHCPECKKKKCPCKKILQ